MSYENIPDELKQLHSWCLWRYEQDKGKVPYQPNGRHASVNDPSSYSSFDECVNRLSVGNNYSGLGFIFTVSDPYTGIDLDNATSNNPSLNKQIEIFNKLNSYSEKSPSGNGVHIIVKGSVPTGVKTSLCEIYSSGRFFTFTGDVCNAVPIEDRQELLTQLWSEIRPVKQQIEVHDEPEIKSDQEIIERCRQAENGDKFAQLYDQELQGDDSAFDMALCNFLVFHSGNNAQVERLFRASVRGKRDKITKRKDYLPRTITRARDKMQNALIPIDIAPLQEAIKFKLASVAQLVEPVPHKNFDLGSNPSTSTSKAGSFNGRTTPFEGVYAGSNPAPATNTPEIPPGLIGRLAQYIYASAPRPVWEVALGNAIATMAGICGKAYTCKGSTLNLYVLIVADTGVGKEAGKDAISTLFRTIDGPLLTPIASKFRGPGQIASGQAIMNYIKSNPSFVCFLGEFGLRIQTMCDARASSTEKNLYGALLDLFGVGKGAIAENIYADKDKSSAAVDGHAMSIIGDTTPDTFYTMIDESLIASGLLPRFIIFEYKGKRQYFNEDKIEVPPPELVRDISGLIVTALGRNSKNIALDVPLDDAAKKAMRDIDTHTTDMMNDTSKGMNKALWNRAHLKIQRLAALCAIGINPHMPTINYACVLWASKIVYHDIELLLKKFESGNVGKNSDIRQQNEIIRVMMHFITQPWSEMSKMDCGTQKMHSHKIVSYKYINKRLSNNASFKGDRSGDATRNITSTIKTLCDMGIIVEIGTMQMKSEYRTGQKAYILTSA